MNERFYVKQHPDAPMEVFQVVDRKNENGSPICECDSIVYAHLIKNLLEAADNTPV